jgi:hypothetical protein
MGVQYEGEEEDKYTKFWWKIPKERDIHKHVSGLSGRVMLDFKERGWVCMGVINLGKIGTMAYCCAHVSDLSGSVKCRQFLYQLGNYKLRTNNSATLS